MSIHHDSRLVVTCYSKAKKMGPDLSVHRPYMAARAARSLVATEQNLRSCIGERKRAERRNVYCHNNTVSCGFTHPFFVENSEGLW